MQWKVYSETTDNWRGCWSCKGFPKNSKLLIWQKFRVLAVYGLSPTLLGGNVLPVQFVFKLLFTIAKSFISIGPIQSVDLVIMELITQLFYLWHEEFTLWHGQLFSTHLWLDEIHVGSLNHVDLIPICGIHSQSVWTCMNLCQSKCLRKSVLLTFFCCLTEKRGKVKRKFSYSGLLLWLWHSWWWLIHGVNIAIFLTCTCCVCPVYREPSTTMQYRSSLTFASWVRLI